jgi:hypothetical protein
VVSKIKVKIDEEMTTVITAIATTSVSLDDDDTDGINKNNNSHRHINGRVGCWLLAVGCPNGNDNDNDRTNVKDCDRSQKATINGKVTVSCGGRSDDSDGVESTSREFLRSANSSEMMGSAACVVKHG